MSKYDVDINEIKSILTARYSDEINEKYDKQKLTLILQRITLDVNNEYLNTRTKAFEEEMLCSEDIKRYLLKLYADCCSEKKCASCVIAKYCNFYIKERIRNYDRKAPVIVDLFCGAGGLSLGFTQTGFITSLANDIEGCCIDTYSHNHPETPRENIVLGDINNVINKLPRLLRFNNIDVVIGGPPCQGFSMANRQRLIDDPRNKLYKSYVKVVELIKPKFFVMENVKGMLSASAQVLEDFKKVGYSVSCKVLNAKEFGVPQNRERLIFIGNRLGIDNEKMFLEIEKGADDIPNFTLADALFGLRPLQALREKNATELNTKTSGCKIEKNNFSTSNKYIELINQGKKTSVIYNHKARYNNDRDIEIYGRLYQGDKSDDPKIADIMPYARRKDVFKDKYFKLEANKVCKTITAHMKFDCNMYIHPFQARGLTPREAARVQSYPDDYYFRGAFTKTYMQIGNSVPPLLGRAIAKVIKNYL